eukprot:340787-Amphidinium_carterae.1
MVLRMSANMVCMLLAAARQDGLAHADFARPNMEKKRNSERHSLSRDQQQHQRECVPQPSQERELEQ